MCNKNCDQMMYNSWDKVCDKQADRQMDGWADRWKNWHIEVDAPPKKVTYRSGYSSKKVTYKEGASPKKELLVQPNKTYQLWSWHNIRPNSWYRSSQITLQCSCNSKTSIMMYEFKFLMKKTKFLVKNNNTKINLWFNGDARASFKCIRGVKKSCQVC